MLDIHEFLSTLAIHRPLFHSEADFQHAFAWHLHELYPHDARIRLEYPVHVDKWIYVDIWADIADTTLAIELKYKTATLEIDWEEEDFRLKHQGAQDTGRYDSVKDIQRLEQIVMRRKNTMGYAIMLTNDSLYWSATQRKTMDIGFRLHEGQVLFGEMLWSEKASFGTTRGRSDALKLTNEYSIMWQEYSSFGIPRGDFRYSMVKIGK